MSKKYIFNGMVLFLLVLSALATIKICFFNMNVDEEYAIALSYRIISEDKMFLDIWEPHQTSGFLTAFLCLIYQAFTGTTEYLVLYLRICGALIQAVISIFLYRTLAMRFSRYGSLAAAFFFFNTLPKQIQTPEFTNMLVWFSVLVMLCCLRACYSSYSQVWLSAVGIFLCALVVSYPSTVLAVPVCFLCLKKVRPQTFGKDVRTVLIICAVVGAGYLFYFLSHMSVEQFLFGLRQMMTDQSHSASAAVRLAACGRELQTFLAPLCAIVLSAVLCMIVYRWAVLKHSNGKFLRHLWICCILCCSCAVQLIIWQLQLSILFPFPLLYFYLLYAAGILIVKQKQLQDRPCCSPLLWFGSVWGGSVWFTAFLITNTTISVTGSYLMCGLISSIVLLAEEAESYAREQRKAALRYRLPAIATAVCLLGMTLFAKGFLVYASQGLRYDVSYVKQKILSGPAKNIYYFYVDGYAYNSYEELFADYCTPEDSLLYVGQHSLYYLMTDSRIAVYSMITTPTFDSRLLEYWSCFPEHYPTLVLMDLGFDRNGYLMDTLNLQEPLAETTEFALYRVEP